MKKYQVVYADPPWDIKYCSRIVRPDQTVMPYKTMKLKDIKELPVKKLADQNGCHLFLWTTHKWLPKAFDVIKSWGFNYHCCLTWDKIYGFTPFSFMFSTEFCLYAQIKGKWLRPKTFGLKTLITAKPGKHSVKPLEMYELIEKYTGGNRIELFARPQNELFPKREGWDVWGNEVESDINLDAYIENRLNKE